MLAAPIAGRCEWMFWTQYSWFTVTPTIDLGQPT